MARRTVNIVCAKSKLPSVPAVRVGGSDLRPKFECSWCGARVKVVA